MKDADGYVYQYRPQHPRAGNNGFVPVHQLVMEEMIGRLMDTRREHIHHIDGNPSNNDPSNLQILKPGIHVRFHRGWKLIGLDWHKPCSPCGRFLKVEGNFYRLGPEKYSGVCIQCSIKSSKARKRAIRNRTARPGRLTERVKRIAGLWGQGLSVPDIAKQIGSNPEHLASDIHGNLRHRWPSLFPYRRNEFRWAERQEAA